METIELRWTDDLPKTFGYYWIREKGIKLGFVAEVRYRFEFDDGDTWIPCSDKWQYSSGPLDPPFDPPPEASLPTLEQVQAAYREGQ